jgi:hypothetical protein
MKFTIFETQTGLTRSISVAVDADTGKQLARVDTIYDDFPLANDDCVPPVSSYSRQFEKTEGISPNQSHTVKVIARHTDGTIDGAEKIWTD